MELHNVSSFLLPSPRLFRKRAVRFSCSASFLISDKRGKRARPEEQIAGCTQDLVVLAVPFCLKCRESLYSRPDSAHVRSYLTLGEPTGTGTFPSAPLYSETAVLRSQAIWPSFFLHSLPLSWTPSESVLLVRSRLPSLLSWEAVWPSWSPSPLPLSCFT